MEQDPNSVIRIRDQRGWQGHCHWLDTARRRAPSVTVQIAEDCPDFLYHWAEVDPTRSRQIGFDDWLRQRVVPCWFIIDEPDRFVFSPKDPTFLTKIRLAFKDHVDLEYPFVRG